MTNNEKIAMFMGAEVREGFSIGGSVTNVIVGEFVETFRKKGLKTGGMKDRMMSDMLKFDTSIEWIIPVVDKIHSLHDSDDPDYSYYERVTELPLISSMWTINYEVLKFIEWYNNFKKVSFYCQIKCGEVGFSIKEWNKAYKEINAMPISDAEKQKLMFPDPCTIQCFDCIAIVGETKLKNKRNDE